MSASNQTDYFSFGASLSYSPDLTSENRQLQSMFFDAVCQRAECGKIGLKDAFDQEAKSVADRKGVTVNELVDLKKNPCALGSATRKVSFRCGYSPSDWNLK